jgi:hypothetical protein
MASPSVRCGTRETVGECSRFDTRGQWRSHLSGKVWQLPYLASFKSNYIYVYFHIIAICMMIFSIFIVWHIYAYSHTIAIHAIILTIFIRIWWIYLYNFVIGKFWSWLCHCSVKPHSPSICFPSAPRRVFWPSIVECLFRLFPIVYSWYCYYFLRMHIPCIYRVLLDDRNNSCAYIECERIRADVS